VYGDIGRSRAIRVEDPFKTINMGVRRVNVRARVCVLVSYILVFTIFRGLRVITWCSSVLAVLVDGGGCDGRVEGGKKSIVSPRSY